MATDSKNNFGTGDQVTPETITAQEQEILKSVRELKYGTVEVTVHDQFIVEVSKREKIRFQKQPAKSESK